MADDLIPKLGNVVSFSIPLLVPLIWYATLKGLEKVHGLVVKEQARRYQKEIDKKERNLVFSSLGRYSNHLLQQLQGERWRRKTLEVRYVTEDNDGPELGRGVITIFDEGGGWQRTTFHDFQKSPNDVYSRHLFQTMFVKQLPYGMVEANMSWNNTQRCWEQSGYWGGAEKEHIGQEYRGSYYCHLAWWYKGRMTPLKIYLLPPHLKKRFLLKRVCEKEGLPLEIEFVIGEYMF